MYINSAAIIAGGTPCGLPKGTIPKKNPIRSQSYHFRRSGKAQTLEKNTRATANTATHQNALAWVGKSTRCPHAKKASKGTVLAIAVSLPRVFLTMIK